MSYPKNKHERFLIGKNKGIKRCILFKNEATQKREERLKRNTTKLCSCSICGNPRRKAWKDKLTLQEKKNLEQYKGL